MFRFLSIICIVLCAVSCSIDSGTGSGESTSDGTDDGQTGEDPIPEPGFTISYTDDDSLNEDIPIVERAEASTDFFHYCSSSSHTGFERAGDSILFFYRDSGHEPAESLSLFIIHGADSPNSMGDCPSGPGGQGAATVDMIIENLPDEVVIALSNDNYQPIEAFWQGTDFRGDWAMGSNSDGAVLDGFPLDTGWEITIRDVFFTGHMDRWLYLRENTTNLPLDPSKDIVISFVPPLSLP